MHRAVVMFVIQASSVIRLPLRNPSLRSERGQRPERLDTACEVCIG